MGRDSRRGCDASQFSRKIKRLMNEGETDIENRLMNMERGEERVRCMERVTWKLTSPGVFNALSEERL